MRESGPEPVRTDTFARQSMIVFGAQMAVNLSNFLFHAFVSRRIGVEQYGSLNALVSAFNIFAVVSVVLTTVVAKTVAELRAVSDDGRVRGFAVQASAILGAVAALVVLAGWLGAGTIATYLQISPASAVITTAGILAINFGLPLRGLLQGAEMFGSYSASLVIEAVLKVVLAIALVAWGFGLNGALVGWLAGAGIALAFTAVAASVRFARAKGERFAFDYRRIGFATAGTVAAGLILAVMQFSDVVIVKHFLDPVPAGLYAAAALAGRMLFLLVNFVPIVMLPRAVRAAREGSGSERVLFLSIGIVAGLAGVGLLLYAFAPALIVTTLAGAPFRPAASLLLPYGISASVFAILNTIVTYRIGVHRLGFLIPLGVVAALEVAGMWWMHSTPLQVIYVLICGSSIGVGACAIGAFERRQKARIAT